MKDTEIALTALALGMMVSTALAEAAPEPSVSEHPFNTAYVFAEMNREARPFYKVGEEIVLTYRIDGVKGAVDTNRYVAYEWLYRDGDPETASPRAFVPVPGKVYEMRAKLDKPGCVCFWMEVWDKILDRKLFRKDCHGRVVRFIKTAFVEPEKMQSVPEPADFDAFWKRHRERLDAVPMNPELVEVCKTPEIRVFRVKLGCAGPTPVTGYMSVPALPGKYPAQLVTDGYGGPSEGTGAQRQMAGGPPDRIVMHINAHGYELNRDPQYYIDFMQKANENGYALYRDGSTLSEQAKAANMNPETCYYAGMTWRIMRALDYVKSRPEWNGKDLYATGVSQGGLQTVWAAALDPKVSWASVQVPWSCDIGGRETMRRIPCRLVVAETPALRYYDPVNMAKRIRCSFDIARAGLSDYTSPPPGIQILYNNLKGPKRVIWYDRMEHKQHKFLRHSFFEESDRLSELVTGFPEGRWDVTETTGTGKDGKTASGGSLEVKRLADGHYTVVFVRADGTKIDFAAPRHEADINVSAGALAVRYRCDDGPANLPFEETLTGVMELTPAPDGSLAGGLRVWYGNERDVNGLYYISLKAAPAKR